MKFRLASPVHRYSPPVGIEHSRRTQRKLSRKSARFLDCAASTASSINSSAWLDFGRASFALPRSEVDRCDVLAFVLRMEREGYAKRLKLRGAVHPPPYRGVSSESIACPPL